MGFINVFTNKKKEPKKPVNFFDEHLDKLIDGDLPCGWLYQNKEFLDQINNEYNHFSTLWIDSRNLSPIKQYEALKSFVLYMQDVKNLCHKKGECFEFWVDEILIGKNNLEKRQNELIELEKNCVTLQEEYEKKIILLQSMKHNLIKLLEENDGILQSDLKKKFDKIIQEEVSEELYILAKEGKLERIKSGRSYILHYKGNTNN